MKNKKKEPLKPCPFCGGEVHTFIGPYKNTVMFICRGCGADVCFYGAEYEPRATRAWNRREVDAVPVVRCKDCKHWGVHKRLNIPWCREMHIDRGAEDFCSMGERKDDE